MLKAAASSDSAAEETLQTRICQTRCSFSRRRRGHLLSQPSRSRGEGEPVRGGGVDVDEYVDSEKRRPVTEGPMSPRELVFRRRRGLADKQGGG